MRLTTTSFTSGGGGAWPSQASSVPAISNCTTQRGAVGREAAWGLHPSAFGSLWRRPPPSSVPGRCTLTRQKCFVSFRLNSPRSTLRPLPLLRALPAAPICPLLRLCPPRGRAEQGSSSQPCWPRCPQGTISLQGHWGTLLARGQPLLVNCWTKVGQLLLSQDPQELLCRAPLQQVQPLPNLGSAEGTAGWGGGTEPRSPLGDGRMGRGQLGFSGPPMFSWGPALHKSCPGSPRAPLLL